MVVAGFAGGLGRGLVEAPFELVKVRRQVEQQWSVLDLYKGSGITLFRNSFLFASFAIYIDFSKQIVKGGLDPFWTGAICGTLAWLTIWPMDVIKSQAQSGNFGNKNWMSLLNEARKNGQLFRGLIPGLARSFFANGASMYVYNEIERNLKSKP